MLDAFIIILVSFVSALFSEVLTYILIYRTDKYKLLAKSVEQLSARLEKKKTEGGVSGAQASAGGSRDNKKLGALDEQLKARQRELSQSKMISTMVVGASMIALFSVLNGIFEGTPVAKLPFEPVGWIRSMSHRGLPGTDWTECSMTFLFLLCSLSIRSHVQRFLGLTPANTGPSMTSMFQPPQPSR